METRPRCDKVDSAGGWP